MAVTVTIYIAFIAGAYLWGSLNFAVLISKLKGRDIRKLGSGNPGTMNMRRQFGFKIAFLTMFLDALKGFLPCMVGWWLLGGGGRWGATDRFGFGTDRIGLYVGGVAAIVGHIFPVFYKFKGGKGVASSIGVGLAINPLLTLGFFIFGFIFMTVTHMGSVTSFIVITPPFIYALFQIRGDGLIAAQILLFALFFLTMWAHRMNFVKLFAGTESKTRVFKGKNEKFVGEKEKGIGSGKAQRMESQG